MVNSYSKYTATLLFFCLFLFGCEKVEIPEPTEEGTRYELSGLKDGEPFYIGLESPEFEVIPHCTLDDHNLWHLSSTIKSKTEDGHPSFLISLRNYNINRQLNAHSFELTEGQHNFYQTEGIIDSIWPLELSFEGTDYVMLENISLQDSMVYLYSDSITLGLDEKSSIPINIVYNVPGASGCIIRSVVDGEQDAGFLPMPNWHIDAQSYDSARLKSAIYYLDEDIANHHWNNNEQNPLTHSDTTGWFNVTYEDIHANRYFHHKHLSKNEEGEFFTYADDLLIAFKWLEKTISRDILQPGSLELQYTNNAGKLFEIAPNQADNNFITIANRSHSVHYETGISALEIDIEFSVDMIANDGEVISFREVSGTIVIGVPL